MSLFWGKVCGNAIPGNVAVKKLLLFLSKKVNCFEGQKAIYPGFIVNINKGLCILHKM